MEFWRLLSVYVLWAAGLAREGYRPFLHTFSVFLSRRILDQVEMSVAYPNVEKLKTAMKNYGIL